MADKLYAKAEETRHLVTAGNLGFVANNTDLYLTSHNAPAVQGLCLLFCLITKPQRFRSAGHCTTADLGL